MYFKYFGPIHPHEEKHSNEDQFWHSIPIFKGKYHILC